MAKTKAVPRTSEDFAEFRKQQTAEFARREADLYAWRLAQVTAQLLAADPRGRIADSVARAREVLSACGIAEAPRAG